MGGGWIVEQKYCQVKARRAKRWEERFQTARTSVLGVSVPWILWMASIFFQTFLWGRCFKHDWFRFCNKNRMNINCLQIGSYSSQTCMKEPWFSGWLVLLWFLQLAAGLGMLLGQFASFARDMKVGGYIAQHSFLRCHVMLRHGALATCCSVSICILRQLIHTLYHDRIQEWIGTDRWRLLAILTRFKIADNEEDGEDSGNEELLNIEAFRDKPVWLMLIDEWCSSPKPGRRMIPTTFEVSWCGAAAPGVVLWRQLDNAGLGANV